MRAAWWVLACLAISAPYGVTVNLWLRLQQSSRLAEAAAEVHRYETAVLQRWLAELENSSDAHVAGLTEELVECRRDAYRGGWVTWYTDEMLRDVTLEIAALESDEDMVGAVIRRKAKILREGFNAEIDLITAHCNDVEHDLWLCQDKQEEDGILEEVGLLHHWLRKCSEATACPFTSGYLAEVESGLVQPRNTHDAWSTR